jgi:hypothetical protein
MTQTSSSGAPPLQDRISGRVIQPDHQDFDDARRLWNAAFDGRPAIIVRCRTAADVSAAVTYATAEGLELAVRCGAHSMSGQSTVDGGLVIDLSEMNGVSVDPEAKRARAGGGALLGDLDAATQAHGLAVPAGLVSHTGVGGLTLGGGMGWLTRKFGLTIDNLVAAEVVTADGRVRRVSDDAEPDLFWAIRGGGGNFGVVTEFEFRLHDVDPTIHLGMVFWTLDQGAEVLRMARDVIAGLPDDVNIVVGSLNAPPEPFVPEHLQLQPGYVMVVVGFGGQESHERVLADIRSRREPSFEFATPMPYVGLQQMLDKANDWGFYCYDKGGYVEDISDDVIDVVTEHMPNKLSPLSLVLFYRLDGAYCDVADDATAFSGGRTPRYGVFMIAVCPAPEMLPGEREWIRGLAAALSPHTIGKGTYVNGASEFDDALVEASYGPKYERLRRIKADVDPSNVFHRNANIKPVEG